MNIIGDVKGKWVIMIDDMIDMVGMIILGVQVLVDVGVIEVYVSCMYLVLFGFVIEWIEKLLIKKLVVMDLIELLVVK